MRKSTKRGLLAGASGAVLVFAAMGPARAGAESSQDSHCVVRAEANTPQPAMSTTCYSYQGAISALTGGQVKLRPGQIFLTDQQVATATETIVGTEYKNSGYGGSTLTMVTGGVFSCSGSNYVAFSSLTSSWDNTIGSAKAYVNCKSGHWEFANPCASGLDETPFLISIPLHGARSENT